MSIVGTIVVVVEEVVADTSGWLLGRVFGAPPALSPRQQARAARVEAKAGALIDEFRGEQRDIAEAARSALQLLGDIPRALRWNEGLKREWSALVLAAVHQAERFGDGTGALKRRFATDLVVRVLARYNLGGLPFLTIQKTLLAPFVGILIDWTVAMLNRRPETWAPVQHVSLPWMKGGVYDGLLRIALVFSALLMWLKGVVFGWRKYDRQLRQALRRIAPEADALTTVLPPERLVGIIDRVADIVVRLGLVTAPYVGLVEHVLCFGEDFIGLSAAERSEVVFRMLQGLLLEAYADDPLVMTIIDSPLGDVLLRAVVEHASWVLAQNGLITAD